MKSKRGHWRFPPELRTLPSNRFGSNQLQRERGLRGSKYGVASKARVYTQEEREAYERSLRKDEV